MSQERLLEVAGLANSTGVPFSPPPVGFLFDMGMTLLHPDGTVLVEELEAAGVTGVDPDSAVAGLQMSCAASHMRLPSRRGVEGRTGLAFAAALDIAPEPAVVALTKALTERDLYRVLDPGAAPMLAGLKDLGLVLGVVSNNDGRLREELDRWSLGGFFDCALDSSVVGVAKPDVEIFRLALDELGLVAADCWYVGDDIVNDVIGGKAAGFGQIVLYDRLNLYRHIPGVLRVTDLRTVVALAEAALA